MELLASPDKHEYYFIGTLYDQNGLEKDHFSYDMSSTDSKLLKESDISDRFELYNSK